ncbi:MAG: hypothetical protein ACI4EN_09655 [Butyrivibrio sp.]
MIKLVIGANASGKTLFLNNCIQRELDNFDVPAFATNLADTLYSDTEYNKKRLEKLEEIFCYADGIDTSNELISVINNPVKLSKDFLQIITILCKDFKRMYIDEPEQGLSEYEINLLCTFLQFTAELYEQLIIVTHSEMLIQLPYYELYTVKMSETSADIELIPVREDEKFEVID